MVAWCKRKAVGLICRIVGYINPALGQNLRFFGIFKKPLNYQNPRLFAEKIMVRMSSKEYEKLTDYVDKWKVREYVEKTIGKQYLTPLLQVYDEPSQINYDKIPEGAYLKLNHGSGYNVIYHKAKKWIVHGKIKRWFREDFSKRAMEMQYKHIKRKILVEENLAPNGERLLDFSFFTFQGKVEFAQIRDNAGHRFEVGREYEQLPFQLYSYVTEIEPAVPEYPFMVELAERLASPFSFVRVDFLWIENKVYFGELTFSPGGGRRSFQPYEYNLIFGDKMG